MNKLFLFLLSTSLLFGTNGDNLIGHGSKSRAMGGVGIATYFGAENVLVNPAMISNTKEAEVDLGITLFMPTVKANGFKSDTEISVMPGIFSSTIIDENWAFGVGVFGAAGMGVDYRGEATLMDARTNLMLMKFVPALAYHTSSLSIGLAPVLQYGSLEIDYNMHGMAGYNIVGDGRSEDFGLGFALGISYDILQNITLGLVYKSEIDMTYKRTLSVASEPFYTMGLFSETFGDDLTQPAEIGIGISYIINNFNLSFDYKKIMWGKAKGYKDFSWNNQDVYALGIKYEKNDAWYSIGYNYAKNPISNHNTNGNPMSTEGAINLFNYLMFPATSEQHFTAGIGTNITEKFSLDCSIVYSPSNDITVNTAIGPLKVEHEETSIILSTKYTF